MATAEQMEFAIRVTVPQAAELVRAYYSARQSVDKWFALDMAKQIPNDKTVILANDGGVAVTGEHIVGLVTRQIELCTDMEANGRAKLNTLLKAAGGRA